MSISQGVCQEAPAIGHMKMDHIETESLIKFRLFYNALNTLLKQLRGNLLPLASSGPHERVWNNRVADAVFSAASNLTECLRQTNEGKLADLVIVCTAAANAFTQALELVERGGTVLFFALPQPGFEIPFPMHNFFFNNLTLTTSYAGSPADYATALELIRAHRIEVGEMVTHRLSLAETGKGFQLIADAQDSIKVIIEPHR